MSMLPSTQPTPDLKTLSRRRVVQSLATLGVLALPQASTMAATRPTGGQAVDDAFQRSWLSRRVQVRDVGMHFRTSGTGAPLVLLHGWPQHSLMWHTIGPLLAKQFTVIAPDQRGVGMSSITPGGYDKTTMARDLAGLLDAVGVDECYVAGYDLGAGTAAAFAREFPRRVRRVAFMEFGLAGFGYEQFMAPAPDWTLNSNWHLALFTVPDAAVWMLTGKERELLAWFFHHFAYSGNASVSPAHFEAYAREISKPGALRAGINYYAAVWQDAKDNQVLKQVPLSMPALALGGESSAGPFGETLWRSVAPNLVAKSIARAGHWLGDENPVASAAALSDFFLADERPLAPFILK